MTKQTHKLNVEHMHTVLIKGGVPYCTECKKLYPDLYVKCPKRGLDR